jgi:hypothetical protein
LSSVRAPTVVPYCCAITISHSPARTTCTLGLGIALDRGEAAAELGAVGARVGEAFAELVAVGACVGGGGTLEAVAVEAGGCDGTAGLEGMDPGVAVAPATPNGGGVPGAANAEPCRDAWFERSEENATAPSTVAVQSPIAGSIDSDRATYLERRRTSNAAETIHKLEIIPAAIGARSSPTLVPIALSAES